MNSVVDEIKTTVNKKQGLRENCTFGPQQSMKFSVQFSKNSAERECDDLLLNYTENFIVQYNTKLVLKIVSFAMQTPENNYNIIDSGMQNTFKNAIC